MQLCKFFKVMSMVIVLALTYIHVQMQIIDLAYRGIKNEQRIKQLVEKNGSAMYNILMLKSANSLGVAMLEKDSNMQFADVHDVVRIAASEGFLMEKPLGEQPKLAKRTNPLLSLLSFSVDAEAKTAE